MILRRQTDEVVSVALRGKNICLESDSFQHHSAPETREATEEEILTVGATEAFENVREVHNFTKEAARNYEARFRHRQLVPQKLAERFDAVPRASQRDLERGNISDKKPPALGHIQVRKREIIVQLHCCQRVYDEQTRQCRLSTQKRYTADLRLDVLYQYIIIKYWVGAKVSGILNKPDLLKERDPWKNLK